MNTVLEMEIGDLNGGLPAYIDLFIASASFEPRSLQIAKHLDKERVGRTCIVCNANHSNYNYTNREALAKLFTESSGQLATIDLDSDSPVKTTDALIGMIREFSVPPDANVVVDVSTFTREALAILLAVMRQFGGANWLITLLYNPAVSYGDPVKLWLSKGLKRVRSIIGYPGEIVPSRPNHLIVLPGYELERAANLIAAFEPNTLSIGMVPKEANFADDFFEQQRVFVMQLQSYYSSRKVDIFEFSARDPFATRDVISRIAATYQKSNKIVIPLNSKPSVVGACLACFDHPDIQMGYAQPKRYNIENYAIPSLRVCKMSISLRPC